MSKLVRLTPVWTPEISEALWCSFSIRLQSNYQHWDHSINVSNQGQLQTFPPWPIWSTVWGLWGEYTFACSTQFFSHKNKKNDNFNPGGCEYLPYSLLVWWSSPMGKHKLQANDINFSPISSYANLKNDKTHLVPIYTITAQVWMWMLCSLITSGRPISISTKPGQAKNISSNIAT